MPKFSIIVPIYNVAFYLDECIESVLRQTNKDYELILVDDGSTDGSALICDKYASTNNVIRVIHKSNGGLVSARIAGVNIATGKYAICLDGDDSLPFDVLEKYDSIINIHRPDIVCAGHYSVCDGKTITFKLPYNDGIYNRGDIEKRFFPILIQSPKAEYFATSVWGKAIRLDLYKECQNRVDTNLSIGEDAACIIQCVSNASTLYITNDCLYNYRLSPDSMCRGGKPIPMSMPQTLYANLVNTLDCEQSWVMEQIYRRAEHDIFIMLASQYKRNISKTETDSAVVDYLDTDFCKMIMRNAKFELTIKTAVMQFALITGFQFIFRMYSKRKIIN